MTGNVTSRNIVILGLLLGLLLILAAPLVIGLAAPVGADDSSAKQAEESAQYSGVDETERYRRTEGTVLFTAGLEVPYAPTPPEVRAAEAVAVLDFETGTLLYGLEEEKPWAPASLTKLVTIYTALDAVEDGRFDLHRPVPVHPEAWASAMPAGSSLMFLGPDQLVNGEDLFRGLLISSGNDAATEVAYRVAGSVGRFARSMNAAMDRAGFPNFYFEEPAGLSPANRITAASFAEFAARLIQRWPEILSGYAARESFTYPEARHFPDGTVQGNPIRQFNRNTLLNDYPGADGLKTGFIEESGYNIVVTAERDGRRLIVVILGVDGASHAEGGRLRADDARRLLDWGFERYRRVEFGAPQLPEVVLWGADREAILPEAVKVAGSVVPTGAVGAIERSIDMESDIWAPVGAGTQIGTVTYTVGTNVIATGPIIIPIDVVRGNVLVRTTDRIRWWLHSDDGSGQ